MADIKLYHGTTEIIAKLAPRQGLRPYNRSDGFADLSNICLTNLYSSFQAFSICQTDERWGIVEVLSAKIERPKYKRITDTGICVPSVPSVAIGKVWTFLPKSNWLVTREVLHITLSLEYHRKNLRRVTQLHRWLTGEFVTLDEWLGEDKKHFNKEQLDQMRSQLMDRLGLELYHHGA